MITPWIRAARNKVMSNRSRTGAEPSRGMRARIGSSGMEATLDGLHQQVADINVELFVELPDPRGAGDIDFCDLAPDHVEADEQHAALGQRGPDLGAEPAVPL